MSSARTSWSDRVLLFFVHLTLMWFSPSILYGQLCLERTEGRVLGSWAVSRFLSSAHLWADVLSNKIVLVPLSKEAGVWVWARAVFALLLFLWDVIWDPKIVGKLLGGLWYSIRVWGHMVGHDLALYGCTRQVEMASFLLPCSSLGAMIHHGSAPQKTVFS